MNYVVSLLLQASNKLVAEALQHLNGPGGRPLFEDEIRPDWVEVYSAIKWMEPPDKLERDGLYLIMEWYEVERSAKAYISWLEKAGAIVLLDFACGEIASDDECLHEEDDDQDLGVYHLRVNNQMERLTSLNLNALLPKCQFDWQDNSEMNVQNIINHIKHDNNKK